MKIKTIDSYTSQEVLALTPAQIEDIIDYTCALEGAPLLPPAPPPAPKRITLPEHYIYKLGGFYIKDKLLAQDILETLQETELVGVDGYGVSARYYPIEPSSWEFPKLERLSLPSSDSYNACGAEIAKWERDMEDWTSYNKLYTEARSARQTVVDSIEAHIHNCRREEDGFQILQAHFNRYIELADGDITMALGFLQDAKQLDSRQEQRLLEEAGWPSHD